MKTSKKVYDLVEQLPWARFYYQGSHSHPVRRDVLIVEDKPDLIVGYEIREGNTVRDLKSAAVKSYRKDRIARWGDYSRLTKPTARKNKKKNESTLERRAIIDLLFERL